MRPMGAAVQIAVVQSRNALGSRRHRDASDDARVRDAAMLVLVEGMSERRNTSGSAMRGYRRLAEALLWWDAALQERKLPGTHSIGSAHATHGAVTPTETLATIYHCVMLPTSSDEW